jgi:hypothetical protein
MAGMGEVVADFDKGCAAALVAVWDFSLSFWKYNYSTNVLNSQWSILVLRRRGLKPPG